MAEELSKRQYKLALILLKYTPFLVAVIYCITTILSCLGIQLVIIPNLFFLSPGIGIVIAYLSYTFKSCIWHRLPIYYCFVLHGISIIDYYLPIMLTDNWMLFVYLLVTIIFILLGMYYKNKYNVKRKISKRIAS